jgi:mRNA-degrading endonuclease toxin of MazEF toxin-antitoxin module
MGTFVKGDVVVIPFPFSDLSATKRRPALVIASLSGDDVILCQITSRTVVNSNAIPITAVDFSDGSLHQDSNIRPDRLFTADSHIAAYRAGSLTTSKVQEVIAKVVEIIDS